MKDLNEAFVHLNVGLPDDVERLKAAGYYKEAVARILGYRIYATRGTAKVLKENGIKAIRTNKLEQPAPNLMDLILGHKIDVVIDTPPQGVEHQKDGFVIRRNAIETGVNVLTSLDTAEALVTSLENTDLHNLTLVDIATIAGR